jgi:hypothetical protein
MPGIGNRRCCSTKPRPLQSFNTLASAGIASTIDPFADDLDSLIGASIFEEVGVFKLRGHSAPN